MSSWHKKASIFWKSKRPERTIITSSPFQDQCLEVQTVRHMPLASICEHKIVHGGAIKDFQIGVSRCANELEFPNCFHVLRWFIIQPGAHQKGQRINKASNVVMTRVCVWYYLTLRPKHRNNQFWAAEVQHGPRISEVSAPLLNQSTHDRQILQIWFDLTS